VDKIKEARKIIMVVWDAMGLVVKQEARKHLPLLNHKNPAHQAVYKAQEAMEHQDAMELVVKQEDHPLVNHKSQEHQVHRKNSYFQSETKLVFI
jgi:hypothetical protein